MGLAHIGWVRMLVAAVVGGAAALTLPFGAGTASSTMGGWTVGALVFVAWTWLLLGRTDAPGTRTHATREDPGRAVGDIALSAASVAAVVGVGYLIAASSRHQGGAQVEALVGLLAILASWAIVHTLFALRYARLYYAEESEAPIGFNSRDDPDYADFAYLAFTVGMTYQVSDNELRTRTVRHTVLRHSLISFLLGAIVLACTINLVSQLASG